MVTPKPRIEPRSRIDATPPSPIFGFTASSAILSVLLCAGCTGIELDPNNFSCNAGGPCLPDTGISSEDDRDASTNIRDGASINRDASADAGLIDPDATTPADTGAPCNAGPSGTWRRLAPANAIARSGHTAVLDEAQSRALIFGGAGADNAVAVLSLAGTPGFQALPTTGELPSARREHAAVYDATRNTMLVFGGVDTGDYFLGDTHDLSLADNTWSTTGFVFSVRVSSAAIYDGEEAHAFGGCGLSGFIYDDEAYYDDFTRSWMPFVRFVGPERRCDAAVSSAGGSMLVHGGRDENGALDDVWLLTGSGPNWVELDRGPSARSGHSAAYDGDRQRALLFGGVSAGDQPLDELWALSITTPENVCWTRLTPGGSERPSARSQHTAFFFGGKMYLYGGTDGSTTFDELWELSF